MPVPQSEWKWLGAPMHFIGGSQCVLHLGTQVGKYVVSTISDYYDRDGNRQQVGCDRWGETYVFEIEGVHDCGCPKIIPTEIDTTFYGEHDRCDVINAGHMAMCQKYAEMQ
jgi:hypothetical protein